MTTGESTGTFWNQQTFIAFDTETTGMWAAANRVVDKLQGVNDLVLIPDRARSISACHLLHRDAVGMVYQGFCG